MSTLITILASAALFALFVAFRGRRECGGGSCGACDGSGCAFSKTGTDDE